MENNLGQEFAQLLLMQDEAVLQFLRKKLEESGTTIPPVLAQRATQLLDTFASGINARKHGEDFLKRQLETTGETGTTFKLGLQETVRNISTGFSLATYMYVGVYLVGLGLVISAVVAGFLAIPIAAWVSGLLGSISLLSFFFAQPPQRLQRSRANLAQLQAAFFAWFSDIYNWNSFLVAQSQRKSLSLDEVREVSKATIDSTREILEMISKNCDFAIAVPPGNSSNKPSTP